MSTALQTPAPPARPAPEGSAAHGVGRLGRWAGIRTVVGMELRQRLRSRGWIILLSVFFLLFGTVTLGALGLHAMGVADMSGMDAAQVESSHRIAGQAMFDGLLMFALTLSLLVAPALAANAISGDRAGGTLAITQVTLLRTGQILAGKWLAAWIVAVVFAAAALPWLVVAAVVGRVSPGYVLVGLLMILVEFAVVTGIGVAVSAIAGRTLFAVVVTYLLVAMLAVGTFVALLLSLQAVTTTVRASNPTYADMPEAMPSDADTMSPQEMDAWYQEQEAEHPEAFDGIADSCTGPVLEQEVPDGRRVAWLVAANPYVVVADALPWSEIPGTVGGADPQAGPLSTASGFYRQAQRDPRDAVECLDGELRSLDQSAAPDREGTWPMWPLGLAMQSALTGGLLWWGHRRLDTPAGRMPKGTRVA